MKFAHSGCVSCVARAGSSGFSLVFVLVIVAGILVILFGSLISPPFPFRLAGVFGLDVLDIWQGYAGGGRYELLGGKPSRNVDDRIDIVPRLGEVNTITVGRA